ncbi:hypothetical protein [Nostoc sp.]|uniref:hypothetical protein n=1 Tax=Nostoc sp. TaxID=1180 RepID=UPI002FF27302
MSTTGYSVTHFTFKLVDTGNCDRVAFETVATRSGDRTYSCKEKAMSTTGYAYALLLIKKAITFR